MLLQYDEPTVYGRAIKPKAEPKDHIRENVQRMRQIQKASRQREQEKQSPVKALWKSSKYEGIPSKVKDDLQNGPPAPRPSSAGYLRAHSRSGLMTRSDGEEESDATTTEAGRKSRKASQEVDYVRMNSELAKHSQGRRSPSLSALDDLRRKKEEEQANYKKGSVPKYLQSRKQQWAAEEADRISKIPDPDCPPGHRIMPNSERLATLEKLRASENELVAQLNSLPIRSDTPRVRSSKEQILAKLSEIDEAIKIFSRSKVFIKMDA